MNTNSYNKQQLLKILKHSKIDHLLLSFNLDNFRDFEKNTFLHLALINNFLQTITTAKLTLRFKMTVYGSIKYKIFCKYVRKWLQKYCNNMCVIINYDGYQYFDSNRCFARDFLKDKRATQIDSVIINKIKPNYHRNLNLNLRILKK